MTTTATIDADGDNDADDSDNDDDSVYNDNVVDQTSLTNMVFNGDLDSDDNRRNSKVLPKSWVLCPVAVVFSTTSLKKLC